MSFLRSAAAFLAATLLATAAPAGEPEPERLRVVANGKAVVQSARPARYVVHAEAGQTLRVSLATAPPADSRYVVFDVLSPVSITPLFVGRPERHSFGRALSEGGDHVIVVRTLSDPMQAFEPAWLWFIPRRYTLTVSLDDAAATDNAVQAQWQYSESGNGTFAYPSAHVPADAGSTLSVHCDPASGPTIVLDTDRGPPAGDDGASILEVRIDREAFSVPVTYLPSDGLVHGPASAPLIAALRAGSGATIASRELGAHAFGLRRSSATIRQALADCAAGRR